MDYLTKSMNGISMVAKAYVRASYIKTAISAFVLGYAVIKTINVFTK